MQRAALRVAGFIFILVALLHTIRALEFVSIQVGSIIIPVYASWIGCLGSSALAVWMLIAAKK